MQLADVTGEVRLEAMRFACNSKATGGSARVIQLTNNAAPKDIHVFHHTTDISGSLLPYNEHIHCIHSAY